MLWNAKWFPGTNLQDLNLDWILKKISALRGGNTGQVLSKKSNKDFDFEWITGGGGGGENGYTFTPSVSSAGVISWTNDGDLPNPEPVNIMGPQGVAGPGLPVGGAANQIAVKASAANYDVAWRNFNFLTSLKNKKCLLIGDSYNNGNGGVSGRGWGYYFTQFTECVSTIVHQNGGGFAATGNAGTATYPGKTYAKCVPLITGDFDYIIVQSGWNDASDSQNPGGIPAIETGVASFITAAKTKWPDAKIVVIVTNNGTDTTFVKANKLKAIAETALKNNVVSSIYSAYWLNNTGVAATDGIHLNDDGYQLLAHLMVDYVNGWDGVYYKANHYTVDASDIITQPNLTAPGTVNCWFDNNVCTLSFDVSLTETLTEWTQILQNVPAPSAALIATVSNWSTTFSRNIRANVGSTGNVSVRYGEAGNYRIFITYQLK